MNKRICSDVKEKGMVDDSEKVGSGLLNDSAGDSDRDLRFTLLPLVYLRIKLDSCIYGIYKISIILIFVQA